MALCRFRMRAFRVLLLVALLTVVVPAPVPAARTLNGVGTPYYVDALNGDDADAGTIEAPFKTITHALSVATELDTIYVSPGTYDTTNGETFPLMVDGESLLAMSGPGEVLLLGDGVNEIMIAEDLADGDGISGFTFSGGAGGPGAALNCRLTVPTSERWPFIANNVFEDNTSDGGGGALNLMTLTNLETSPLVVGNTFTHNSATDSSDGGAVQVLNYVNAIFEDNVFDDNAAATGGAIAAGTTDSTITIAGNTFVGNDATSYGGAIMMSVAGGEKHTIEGNEFYGNEAASGGALWLYAVTASLRGNDAGGNNAVGDGGFAWMQYCVVEAENNAIGGGEADQGGAWYLHDAALFERNDTIGDMTSEAAAYGNMDATLEITNCIYWNEGASVDIRNADEVSYSCVHDALVGDASRGNTVGVGVIDDDPMFMTAIEHDARLLLGSPCIDAGYNADAAEDDFYGTARPVDGDGDGTAVVDMGFFERPVSELTVLAGDDRYETAVEVARETFPDMRGTVVIASGQNFPDALSAAGLAGAVDAPLLLTKAATLPAEVIALMDDWGVAFAYVIGGEAAVSADVFDEIEQHAYHDTVRIAGDDRYETAALVAEEIAQETGNDFVPHAFIARGDAFPDALSASPLAYANAVPILLSKPSSLPAVTAAALDTLGIEGAVVVGGTSAVGATPKAAVDAVLVANGGSASERWFGADRYATAAAVAENAVQDGWATWDTVGIATGQNYPDALAGGARVGARGGVVLLTRTDYLPAVSEDALEAHADDVLYTDIFGGPVAVSQTVHDAVKEALGW